VNNLDRLVVEALTKDMIKKWFNCRHLRTELIGSFFLFNLIAHGEPTNAPSKIHSPVDTKAGDKARLEGMVIRWAAEEDPDYSRVFAELGLKAEDRERFKTNLTELVRKAIAAGEPLRELLEARMAYDQEIHGALGDENYQRYRTYEESKLARREYVLLREFATKYHNFPMDPAFSEKIIELIKAAKATTTESWAGPYDPRPQPEVGQKAVLTSLKRRITELRQNSSNLVEILPKIELPEPYQQVLKKYYSQKLLEMEQQIKEFSISKEERLRRLRLEVQEMERIKPEQRSNSTNLLF